jgi:hypothetical protein
LDDGSSRKNAFDNEICLIHNPWRGGRVVEGTGLEILRGTFTQLPRVMSHNKI